MEPGNAVDEDWELLRSFFPAEWMTLAVQSGALKGLRQDKSAETLLRVLLLHVGGGFSLRETVVRARAAHWAELSDVAQYAKEVEPAGRPTAAAPKASGNICGQRQ
jgi:hypothetical protein